MRGVFDEMTAVRWACGTEDGSHQRPLYGAATASNVAHGLFHSSGGMITPGGGDPGGDHGKPNTRRTSGVHAKGVCVVLRSPRPSVPTPHLFCRPHAFFIFS